MRCGWNIDGTVDVSDLVAVSSNFGKGNCGGVSTQPTTGGSGCGSPQPIPTTPQYAGSCKDSCGGKTKTAGGYCYCDTACTTYGDCCADFKAECPAIYNANK